MVKVPTNILKMNEQGVQRFRGDNSVSRRGDQVMNVDDHHQARVG